MGSPSKLEDKVREDEEKERKANENPDWQDPELLKVGYHFNVEYIMLDVLKNSSFV